MRYIALQTAKALLAIVLIFSLAPSPSFASEINSCKYLVVSDFTQDPYGLAKELRAQGGAKGFVIVSGVTQVPPADLLKTCVMTGSWARDLSGGEVSVRVVDASSGALIAEAVASGSRIGVASTVRFLVKKIYSQLGYTGYTEEVYRERIQREYPARPMVAITEDEIKKRETRSPVQGIWADDQNQYRLGILPAPNGDADYIAVVLKSNTPVWQPGEIKAEIRTTASPTVFTATYFMLNKRPIGTTFTLDHAVLHASVKTQAGSTDVVLLRVWPALADDSVASTTTAEIALGSGFLLNHNGLVATNWHVVAGAKNIEIAFPDFKEGIRAEVAIKDSTNDLAILRLSDLTELENSCREFPFQLVSSNRVALGERVSTIGYPLQSILGSNPKFSEGVVASQTGFQNDPRSLQISAEIQPGSSGSPLFVGKGDIVGIVVATLDAAKLYAIAGALPQNVNLAVKSDYLLTLIGMLPNESASSRTTDFSPEKAAKCVVAIKAW